MKEVYVVWRMPLILPDCSPQNFSPEAAFETLKLAGDYILYRTSHSPDRGHVITRLEINSVSDA